tara:strand:+ start:14529 stop:14840 length:312 start_codon:yes stop_codon:yes gene_type:complete
MKDFAALALNFKTKVAELGFVFQISESGSIVSVHKSFEKGNTDEFVKCDMNGPFLISLVPSNGGSVWGTDGGSVGGHSAVTNGNYYLKVSGAKASFVKQLKKL